MKTAERLLKVTENIWSSYNLHPFVMGIQEGTLDKEKFRYYIMQDYLYLKDYAKTFAVGVAKAKSQETSDLFAKYIPVMHGEPNVHGGYLAKLNVTEEEMNAMKPSFENISYTSYMLRVAYEEGEVEILTAILSCAYSYEVIAKNMIRNNPKCTDDPFYGEWIRGYASKEYADGNRVLLNTLDKLTENCSEEHLKHLEDIFFLCSEYEYEFWQMSWAIFE